MKKTIVLIMCMLLLTSFVLAVEGDGQGVHEPGTGQEDGVPMLTGEGQGQGEPKPMLLGDGNGSQQQNEGEEKQLRVQEKTQLGEGEFMNAEGKQIKLEKKVNEKSQLKAGNSVAKTGLELTQEMNQEQTQTKLMTKLSNGKNAEIKVMPDTASEKALERLRLKTCSEENNCQIELKEVGKGEEVKAAYEVKVQKNSRVLGLFKAKMQVQAQIDAETGEVIQSKKPWWAFLASESEE